jgi:hypothetical protein
MFQKHYDITCHICGEYINPDGTGCPNHQDDDDTFIDDLEDVRPGVDYFLEDDYEDFN